jgi:hypothetical protein
MSGLGVLIEREGSVTCPHSQGGLLYTQFRLLSFLGVQLPFLVLVQSVELSFHELHPLFLRDFAAPVGIYKEKQRCARLRRSLPASLPSGLW